MALTGNEVVYVQGVDGKGSPAATSFPTTTGAISALSSAGSINTVITALNTVGNGTITAAGIYGKVVNRGGTQVAAFTDTTDTAANIIAALPAGSQVIGDAFKFTYENNTAFPVTLTGGTGVTVSGITVLPANTWGEYIVTYTAANTITIVSIESGFIASMGGAQFTAVSGNTPLTLTGAQFGGGADVTINLTAALAGAGTVTVPTVANLVAAIPNAAAGASYNLRIINSSSGAFAWTVTTNTGWTLTGTMTIAQNTFRDFVVTLNSLTAATLQQCGTGTTS